MDAPKNKKTLVLFYARIIRKGQMKIEEVEADLREDVRVKIAELDSQEEVQK